MRISELCRRNVVTCPPSASVLELARSMRDHHVGDVVVVEMRDGAAVPVGIVTDRDLVVKVLARDVGAEMVTAADVMGAELTTAAATEGVYDAIWHMRSRGIRRLPVVDQRCALVGMVTADDVTAFLATELTEVSRIAPRQLGLEQRTLAPTVG